MLCHKIDNNVLTNVNFFQALISHLRAKVVCVTAMIIINSHLSTQFKYMIFVYSFTCLPVIGQLFDSMIVYGIKGLQLPIWNL